MLVRAKWLKVPSYLAAADQKLLTFLNQYLRRNRLFNPGDLAKLSKKLPILLMS